MLGLDPRFRIPATVLIPKSQIKPGKTGLSSKNGLEALSSPDPAVRSRVGLGKALITAEKAYEQLVRIRGDRCVQGNEELREAGVDLGTLLSDDDQTNSKLNSITHHPWYKDCKKILKESQGSSSSDGSSSNTVPLQLRRGVAKLGYSWEAFDVRLIHFRNETYNLTHALMDLAFQTRLTKEPTGSSGIDAMHLIKDVGTASHVDHVIVQEYIPHTLELRLYYMENELKMHWFTKFVDQSDTRVKNFQYRNTY